MLRTLVLILSVGLITPGTVQAEAYGRNDVCKARPDLCAKGNFRKKGKTKKRKPCRENDPRPICRNEAARAAAEMYAEELNEDPRFGSKDYRESPTDDSYAYRPRKSDSELDRYVNTNAAHPSLARKPDAQQAFVDAKPKVYYGFGGSGASREDQGSADSGPTADSNASSPGTTNATVGGEGNKPAPNQPNR